jgi:hypothetical protein
MVFASEELCELLEQSENLQDDTRGKLSQVIQSIEAELSSLEMRGDLTLPPETPARFTILSP